MFSMLVGEMFEVKAVSAERGQLSRSATW